MTQPGGEAEASPHEQPCLTPMPPPRTVRGFSLSPGFRLPGLADALRAVDARIRRARAAPRGRRVRRRGHTRPLGGRARGTRVAQTGVGARPRTAQSRSDSGARRNRNGRAEGAFRPESAGSITRLLRIDEPPLDPLPNRRCETLDGRELRIGPSRQSTRARVVSRAAAYESLTRAANVSGGPVRSPADSALPGVSSGSPLVAWKSRVSSRSRAPASRSSVARLARC